MNDDTRSRSENPMATAKVPPMSAMVVDSRWTLRVSARQSATM